MKKQWISKFREKLFLIILLLGFNQLLIGQSDSIKAPKSAFGMEVGALYNSSLKLAFGCSYLKLEGGGYNTGVYKLSTGFELGTFQDKTIYHYIEYTRSFFLIEYSLRFNQYIKSNYYVSLMPHIGLSLGGKYNLYAGYLLTNDFSNRNLFTVGFNCIFARNKFFTYLG